MMDRKWLGFYVAPVPGALFAGRLGVVLGCAWLGACAGPPSGYGVGPQVEREVKMQQATRNVTPDTPGMYLGLIERMQAQGLYYASLAHIDAYEKQYGVSPDTMLLRADALRATDQPAASAASYTALLKTPLAARGYRGLGLLAGASGDFPAATQALQQAAQLAPTDAVTLSDLGYARLRSGDINGARVPLMQAAELDQHNPRIMSNVTLYLLAEGRQAQAQALMNEQKIADNVRETIQNEARRVVVASQAWTRAGHSSSETPAASTSAAVPVPPGATSNASGESKPAVALDVSTAESKPAVALDAPTASKPVLASVVFAKSKPTVALDTSIAESKPPVALDAPTASKPVLASVVFAKSKPAVASDTSIAESKLPVASDAPTASKLIMAPPPLLPSTKAMESGQTETATSSMASQPGSVQTVAAETVPASGSDKHAAMQDPAVYQALRMLQRFAQ